MEQGKMFKMGDYWGVNQFSGNEASGPFTWKNNEWHNDRIATGDWIMYLDLERGDSNQLRLLGVFPRYLFLHIKSNNKFTIGPSNTWYNKIGAVLMEVNENGQTEIEAM
jgi:hypothetical protein